MKSYLQGRISKAISIAAMSLFFFIVIKFQIEPWVIETVCRELIKCETKG